MASGRAAGRRARRRCRAPDRADPGRRRAAPARPLRGAPASARFRRAGSSARSSTAAPVPSSAQTTFAHQWIPYERYTYRWPGGPNMAAFRVVRPRYEWLAGSSGAYASVSTTTPPTPSTRNVAPISPRATAVHVLREERAVASSGVRQSQKSCSVSDGLAVAASTRRARRPRSPRSTRPSSAAAASRSARSSAWSRSTESPPS